MPTPTYDLIASNVVTSAVTSFSFSSISNTYRDLVLVIRGQGGNNDFYPRFRFNGNSSAAYFYVEMVGTGSAVQNFSGNSETGFQLSGAFATTTTPALFTVQMFDTNQSNKHKPAIVRSGRTGNRTGFLYGRWANTDAVTSLDIYSSNGGTFTGTFYLYGIVS